MSGWRIHVRWCVARNNHSFQFNINRTTLEADFELWVVGSRVSYYLLPVEVMRAIYKDPDAYPDRTHVAARLVVVSGNTFDDRLNYARGRRRSISEYRLAKLPAGK